MGIVSLQYNVAIAFGVQIQVGIRVVSGNVNKPLKYMQNLPHVLLTSGEFI